MYVQLAGGGGGDTGWKAPMLVLGERFRRHEHRSRGRCAAIRAGESLSPSSQIVVI